MKHERPKVTQAEQSGTSPWGGRRVVITGGSRGLGLGLTKALTAAGAHVAIIARQERALAAAAELTGAATIVGDVADKNSTHGLAASAVQALGGVDVLIHNASDLGSRPLKLLADTDCEDLERVLAANLVGPFRLTKALLSPLLLGERRGVGLVVHVSSDAAVNAYATWGAYSVSKAAGDHLARIFDAELSSQGLRFLAIDPGDMATALHFEANPDADPSALLDPEDVGADLSIFLGQEIEAGKGSRSGVRRSAADWRRDLRQGKAARHVR